MAARHPISAITGSSGENARARSRGAIAKSIAQNAMIDAGRDKEERVVTVDFIYNTDRHGTAEYRYQVKNLLGIP